MTGDNLPWVTEHIHLLRRNAAALRSVAQTAPELAVNLRRMAFELQTAAHIVAAGTGSRAEC